MADLLRGKKMGRRQWRSEKKGNDEKIRMKRVYPQGVGENGKWEWCDLFLNRLACQSFPRFIPPWVSITTRFFKWNLVKSGKMKKSTKDELQKSLRISLLIISILNYTKFRVVTAQQSLVLDYNILCSSPSTSSHLKASIKRQRFFHFLYTSFSSS